jgi:DNA-binding PadR family transcriptional regulator
MRSDVLESTILGILQSEPTLGYDLRQQLASILGPFRALSYGSLYPCLKRMERAGLISRRDDSLPVTPARRSKIVYELTPAGTEHFAGWIGTQTPSDWEDEGFAAKMAFFSRTEAKLRLRILEGRRTRLEQRLSDLGDSIDITSKRVDTYTDLLQRHGLDGARREVSWIEELISTERTSHPSIPPALRSTT